MGRWKFDRRRSITIVAMMACASWAPVLASPLQHSSVRLLDGGIRSPGRLAGLEIRLDPGFITYWRSPGEAGVAPVFDFSGSTNVKEAKVLYPAPSLIEEDGIAAYGYEGGVVFPLEVTPKDAAAPVRLDLELDYAVCSKLCLPAKAHATIDLDAAATAEDEAVIRRALDKVPRPAQLGEAGPMAIASVNWTSATTLEVKARVAGGVGTLFAEAPDPWYFSVSSPHPVDEGTTLAFVLTGPDHPPPPPLPAEPLRLTLVGPSGGIEVPLRLDAIASKP